MYRGAPSQGKASGIWRGIHSAVGLVVTLIQTRSLRSIRTITKPYDSLKQKVGTTKRSMAAMSGARFRRKVFHLSASSLLFDSNGEASTAGTNQISAIIAP